jgi:ComF family protein
MFSWLKTFFPQNCYLCGVPSDHLLCPHCLTDLPYYNLENCCQRCARPLDQKSEEILCLRCHLTPPAFSRTYPIFSYRYPINCLIQQAKFDENLTILTLLGKLMAQRLDYEHRPDILIPIPLHPKRLRQRGYNQALELTKIIARHSRLPFSNHICRRIRYTTPQAQLDGRERETNLTNAFKIQYLNQNWRHIALIDDVMTTGTTVDEVATVLLQAGVRQVDVWCCARTLENRSSEQVEIYK